MKGETRRRILGAVGLAWLVCVIGFYYFGHKPLEPALASSIGLMAWRTLVVAGILSLAGALGSLFLDEDPTMPVASLALQAALGLGLLSLIWLLIGATAGFSRVLLGGGLLVPLILLRRRAGNWWSGWRRFVEYWQKASWFGRTLALSLGLVLSISLGTALAPPIKFDALVYHFTLPQDYLEAGRLVYSPDLMYWGMPQLTEILYTWAMGLAGGPAAAVLGWAFGALALAGVLDTLANQMGLQEAWVGAASLLAGFSLADSLAWGYVGWATLLYGWAVLTLLIEWRKSRRDRDLFLAGIFAGLALGVKYTAGILVLVGLGAILLDRRRLDWGSFFTGGRYLLGAGVASAPWWIKNALATSNPFYPLLFPAGAMDSVRLAAFQAQPPWGGWGDSAFLPWQATMTGFEAAPGFSASVGPLLLALSAIFWLGRDRPGSRGWRMVQTAAWFVGLGWIVWAVAGRISGLLIQTRLYLAIFPALAVLAAAGFGGLAAIRWPGVRLRRVVGALVLLVLLLNVVQLLRTSVARGVPAYLTAGLEEDDYLADNLGWYAPASAAVSGLPPGSRAVLLWEPRGYYCRPNCEPDEILDRWLTDSGRYGEPTEILQAWLGQGFTHVLYYKPGAEFVRGQDSTYPVNAWLMLDELLSSLPPPTSFGDVYELYPLTS